MAVSEGPERAGTVEVGLRRLFAALEEGDADSLGAIYEWTSAELYALALWVTGSAEDAADAVQNVFVALATTRARLGRVERPRSYLMRMTHHAAARIARRRRPAEAADALLLAAPGAGPEVRALAAQASERLISLPARQREAIFLHLMGGLSFREIGAVTGVSRFTAASRFRLGMARLKEMMGVDR